VCPNLEEGFPTLDATRVPDSKSDGQRSALEAGGGITCWPNPEATLLVNLILIFGWFDHLTGLTKYSLLTAPHPHSPGKRGRGAETADTDV